MRLIASKIPDVSLGFISEGHEVILELTALRGSVVAFDSRGLRALQIVRGDRSVSDWIGCPVNTPVMERLVQFEIIDHLEVGFDVSTDLYKSLL